MTAQGKFVGLGKFAMRLNGFHQHLALFSADGREPAAVMVSTRPTEVAKVVAGNSDCSEERDRALCALSQRFAGRVADGLEATPDV